MKFSLIVERLKSLVDQLKQDAKSLDSKNQQGRNQYQFEDKAIFSDHLFSTRSGQYFAYVKEIDSKVKQLTELIDKESLPIAQTPITQTLVEQIELQISSLLTAIQANKARRKKFVANRARKANTKQEQFKQAAQAILLPTHQLYAKLAEHHEFERRLATMIAEREYKRAEADATSSQQLSQEILALHQRLGRCRQAITGIEREIELAEKRNN